MDETTFLKANKRYLEIAKSLTDYLYELCIDSKEYTGLEIINGISTGVYIFFKGLSKDVGLNTLDLYESFDKWFKHMDNIMKSDEVQTQKGVSGSENKMVGETASEL